MFSLNQNKSQSILTPDFYDDGYLRIEYDNYFVSCNNQRIKLPRTEFLILARLSQQPERIVSYQELWNCAWEDKPLKVETLKVHIYNLRRVFQPFGVMIETLINIGYCIVVPKDVILTN